MKIVFSILHYQTTDVTRDCINSILTLEKNGHQIYVVVVDNGSSNGSGLVLEQEYEKNEVVHVLRTNKNLGFANGNNIGYEYAKRKLDADIVLVLNNDVVITQEDFLNVLVSHVINDDKIAVWAPDILNLINEHQNPIRNHRIHLYEITWMFFYNVFIFLCMHIPIINQAIVDMLHMIHKKRGIKENEMKEHKVNKMNVIVPHGAAIIFSPTFVHNEDKVFNARTFLYAEEDLLYEYLYRKKYKIRYCSDLVIYHLEDVSTDSISNDEIRKRIFVSRQKIRSLAILFFVRLGIVW